MTRVFDRFILGVFSHLCVVVFQEDIIIWEQLKDSIDNIVKLLELSSKSSLELLAFLETSMYFKKLSVRDRIHT